jgi:endoglucanase
VKTVVDDAASKNQTPIMVVYNIPARDCGGYSSGGSNSPESYKSWVRSFAKGVGNRSAYVILEPDAIPGADCLSENNRQVRYDLLKDAVGVLKAGSGTKVYIDAGHCNWKSVDETADRLNRSGINQADGFALNVSNFQTNECLIDFGTKLSAKVGNKHFVLDTSRNGVGPNQGNEWCNPTGRALGTTSTTNTGNSLVDAYLWIKTVGESDGNCNGGPSAGQFWPEYAVGLAQKAGF